MKLEIIKELSRYQEIIDTYRRKGCISNDYLYAEVAGLISKDCLFECCQKDNAFFFLRKDKCWRVYYYLNDLSELFSFDEQENYVTEIIYRGNSGVSDLEIDYLVKCGFRPHLTRHLYCGIYKDLLTSANTAFVVRKAISLDEVHLACELFNATFDPYSGDYISDSMIPQLFADGAIWIATDGEGHFAGALHQTIERGVSWVSHVVVKSAFRGKGIGRTLLDAFVEFNHVDEKSRYMLWVQANNEPAVGMYQNKGFKYVNKSSLSLLITK